MRTKALFFSEMESKVVAENKDEVVQRWRMSSPGKKSSSNMFWGPCLPGPSVKIQIPRPHPRP